MIEGNGGGYGRIAITPQEDAELTHVSFKTPMGELLRRYWQPVALSAELKDLPKRIQILGEELVAFRDGSGRVGVLGVHCAHRGTSLEYGRIAPEGIRCCYHGWQYDIDGTIQEYEITRKSYEETRQVLTRAQLVERIVEAGRDPVERDNVYNTLSTHREIQDEKPVGVAGEIPLAS